MVSTISNIAFSLESSLACLKMLRSSSGEKYPMDVQASTQHQRVWKLSRMKIRFFRENLLKNN
ncbi:hypothetical protein DRO41_05290 [Candidatus Bathyarchaeota archaeon]|nr:MAG: hypothetical protein DRO41_05290 [Candidatus Bathyarchaeota archaeon]